MRESLAGPAIVNHARACNSPITDAPCRLENHAGKTKLVCAQPSNRHSLYPRLGLHAAHLELNVQRPTGWIERLIGSGTGGT